MRNEAEIGERFLSSLVVLMGFSLLALGGFGALVTFKLAYNAIVLGDSFQLLKNLTAAQNLTINLPQVGNVAIPQGLVSISGYGVVVGLLFILASISGSFVRSGAQLLKPDLNGVLKELVAELKRQR